MLAEDILSKPYDPKNTEDRIYAMWENGGYFRPDTSKKRVFSMVLPPPNVTGRLHMGHAAMLAIQDVLARYHRMRGYNTLWIPGTDHASIATQSKVEQELYKKDKQTRHDLGRDDFIKLVKDYAKQSHDTIVHQIKKMGASLDWEREAYTLDEKRSLSVRTAFKKMYEAGLIYRGYRIVNWDPKLQTTVSDDEIERTEEKAPLYYLKYGPFTIVTARPETKFGDKYVVMHPEDKRYAEYKNGEEIKLDWINGAVTATVIKDEIIDMEFGTGVMTITPAHDATDYGIAIRHNLDIEKVIDLNGKLLPVAGEFVGIHIKKARPKVVEKLKEMGLLLKVDEHYSHGIPTNARGGGTIEPQILKQWFVNVDKEFTLDQSNLSGVGTKTTLKKILKETVANGQIEIVPNRFDKTYFHWIDGLRDWCISRQIWYGHRIPAWYPPKGSAEFDKGEIYVGVEPPNKDGWVQDPDTLDTWFSSGLWTFSTLGWPENTKDLEMYHPTSILETGYDILFFWVARMILMSGFLLGTVPFKKAYLHGMVRDKNGKKMSKSLNNIIDPLEMIEKYGADATRLSLIIGTPPGNDLSLSEDKIKGYKHFINKVWNASRFVFENTKDISVSEKPQLVPKDIKYLADIEKLANDITEDIESFRFYLACEKLYHYFWHTFADIIIEEAKSRIRNGTSEEKASAKWCLMKILEINLKLLHPFAPFITEELWKVIPHKKMLLIQESWPTK